ncbi:hypothetical protein [Undibacterium terreum]|uniref:Uncharacterized protein n=1 Tax=Undibacterium terreum TaxID=1224302 RepID=A0A916U9L2_9BURK|nr:hypothetical protein [Undibacterium terreum]GGC64150.1 hypothetical protein GCM10011396_08890 [Undibacterium terreum]
MYPRAYLYFSSVLVICIAGFWRSFFSHPLTNHSPHLVHGVAATAWVCLLILQAWLVRTKKLAIHRQTGKLAYVLAPLLVVSGFVVGFVMLAQPDHFPPTMRAKLTFYDVVSLLLFSWLFFMAIRHKKSVQLHARYMSATALVLLPPAIPRLISFAWPYPMSFSMMIHIATLTSEIILVLLILNDYRLKQVRLPFPATLAVFVVMHICMGFIADVPLWQQFLAWPAKVSA